ncbi:hypothetical protein M3Y99_00080200 [Aphelenchoides fujianensis]|nr:hypothetical protein M3Y99_00080200 [Aphelenchoides fujianensis]
MLRIAHYRAWIYILNFVLISLQLVLVQLIALVAADPPPFFVPRWTTFTFFWSSCSARSAFRASRKELPLTIQHMAAANMQSYSQVCNSWKELQSDLSCCPPPAVLSTCQDLPASCPTGQTLCHYALLRWLHSNTDLLAAVIYFFLFPLKLIIVVMLREDISELLAEILHLHNRQTYRHWLLDAETQEDESSGCDSQGNSKLSSPADYETVLLPRGRNGSIARL